MNLIINNSSMTPIYEQIAEGIRALIVEGSLAAGTMLPSVRTMAKDLRISALTAKKAYDRLEEEELIVTVHGKGSFVSEANKNRLEEERRKDAETALEQAIQKGRVNGLSDDDIRQMFNLLMEE